MAANEKSIKINFKRKYISFEMFIDDGYENKNNCQRYNFINNMKMIYSDQANDDESLLFLLINIIFQNKQ